MPVGTSERSPRLDAGSSSLRELEPTASSSSGRWRWPCPVLGLLVLPEEDRREASGVAAVLEDDLVARGELVEIGNLGRNVDPDVVHDHGLVFQPDGLQAALQGQKSGSK